MAQGKAQGRPAQTETRQPGGRMNGVASTHSSEGASPCPFFAEPSNGLFESCWPNAAPIKNL